MADVLNRITREFIQSANTPDYPVADWIHNPDLSAVTTRTAAQVKTAIRNKLGV